MGKNIKLPLETGFAALCAHIKSIRATAEQSGSAVAALAESTAASLEEIDSLLDGKQDKGSGIPVTIPAEGWAMDEGDEDAGAADSSSYPYYYDIPAAGVSALDRADVTITASSCDAATACGLCPASETLAGAIRLRAVTPPTEAMTAEYWLHSGKE